MFSRKKVLFATSHRQSGQSSPYHLFCWVWYIVLFQKCQKTFEVNGNSTLSCSLNCVGDTGVNNSKNLGLHCKESIYVCTSLIPVVLNYIPGIYTSETCSTLFATLYSRSLSMGESTSDLLLACHLMMEGSRTSTKYSHTDSDVILGTFDFLTICQTII